MRVDQFDFYLPEERIAQTPLSDRSASKLMVVNPKSGQIDHQQFPHIIDSLHSGDVLVLNNTRVLPARLFAHKTETGANMELLLLRQMEPDVWEVLAKPARRLKAGMYLDFGVSEKFTAEVLEELEDGRRLIKFQYEGIFMEWLEELGAMPLPPYITEKLEDRERYQTVYAQQYGAVAAPTAGLHFTKELLDAVQAKGVQLVYVTLHVGLGTFRPVSVDHVNEHQMHSEWFSLDEPSARCLQDAKREGRRIIAVGTTSCRVLETIGQMAGDHELKASEGWTDIFIYPGYQFRVIDGLITNFHLPKSTLLMLVSAFASREIIMKAYEEAVNNSYRFFSFGDAMFLNGKVEK